MTTRQKNRPRTRRLAGGFGLLLALLVGSLAPVPAAVCCDPAAPTADKAICGGECCGADADADASVCAPRTPEAVAAATGIVSPQAPGVATYPAPGMNPVPAAVPLARFVSPRPAAGPPHLSDIPLLV